MTSSSSKTRFFPSFCSCHLSTQALSSALLLTFVATTMSRCRGVYNFFFISFKTSPKSQIQQTSPNFSWLKYTSSNAVIHRGIVDTCFLYHPIFNLLTHPASYSFSRSWIWTGLTTFRTTPAPGAVAAASLMMLPPPTLPPQSQPSIVIMAQLDWKLPHGFCRHIQSKIPSSSRLNS